MSERLLIGAALAVVALLAAVAGGASGLIWLGWWHPGGLAVGLGVGALATGAGLAARHWPRGRRLAWPRLPARAPAGHVAALAAGLGLWLLALARTDLGSLDEFGLLFAVHPAYLAAMLVCVGGFVLALRGGASGVVFAGYAGLLIVILHATTPLLLAEPEYAWTYKHVGVVELLRTHGGLTDSADIYQQWPALFAAVAWLADVTGVAPLTLAPWAPVFFNVVGGLVVLAIARTLTADRQVAYLTVFSFLAVNWVALDYLSPQALAFVLSLGVLLVVIRWLRPQVPARQRLAALALLVPLFGVLTAAHQLSPYLVVAQVAAAVLVGRVRPWWTAPLLVAVAAAYLLPRLGMLSGSFQLFEGFELLRNAAGNAEGWGSSGQRFSAVVVRGLAVTVWGLAALACWRAHRSGDPRLRRLAGPFSLPVIFAVTPFALLAAHSYGGEAIYRVFLFSAPWCAFLIALLMLGRLRRPPAAPRPPTRPEHRTRAGLTAALATLVLLGAGLATVQGRHGQLWVNQQSVEEVAGARHLYAHAERGATIAIITPHFPARLTAEYDKFNRDLAVGEPDLVTGAGLHGQPLDRHLPQIEEFLHSFEGTTAYLVVSEGMRRQAEYFGYLPAGSIDALTHRLDQAPDWSVFHRNPDVVIYELRSADPRPGGPLAGGAASPDRPGV